MATSLKRVYWDACTWIALIQKEKIRDPQGVITEDRETMCREVIAAARANKCEIVTSALSFVEVCKKPEVRAEGEDKIAAFFEHDFIIIANLDRNAGERGRELMLVGYSGLKPPDASHVATAAISNADEMHTFDKKLLDMDGLIDKANGTKLKICKPDVGNPLPLLEAAAREQLEEASDEDLSEQGIPHARPEKDNEAASDEKSDGPGADRTAGANEIRRCSEEASERSGETETAKENSEELVGSPSPPSGAMPQTEQLPHPSANETKNPNP